LLRGRRRVACSTRMNKHVKIFGHESIWILNTSTNTAMDSGSAN
jgi:hypothetical protein